MEQPETDCQAVLERLYLYIDGEMAAPDCAGMEKHLRECGDCLHHAEFERAVKEIVRRKCCDEAPPGLVERLHNLL